MLRSEASEQSAPAGASAGHGARRRHWARRLRPALPALGLTLLAWPIGGGPAAADDSAPDRDLECLALNVYFEARGEPVEGQEAVAHVALNRSRDPRFPSGLCDVIYQHDGNLGPDCAFSWTCDGLSDRPTDMAAWRRSREIARLVRDGKTDDPTGGALWFHADYVSPYWSPGVDSAQRIGRHFFYRTLGDGFRLARVLRGDADGAASGEGGNGVARGASGGAPALDQRSIALLTKAMVQFGAADAGLDISIQYHGWNAAKRAVRINGATFREGDSPAPGILVETILKTGVVFSCDKGRTKRILKG